MYYHIQLRKINHDGCEVETERKDWDFRSLHQGLSMVMRDFGPESRGWRIEDLTDRVSDLMSIEAKLSDALMSKYQYVIMTFKEESALLQKYDNYQFFVVVRDESERPPLYSFPEKDELAIAQPLSNAQSDLEQTIRDVLKSFEMTIDIDALERAYESFECYGEDDESVIMIRNVREKQAKSAEDYIRVADECIKNGDDPFAAVLYADAIMESTPGASKTKGKALSKLANLYMTSKWTEMPWRERDDMKAAKLYEHALSQGYVRASHYLNEIRTGRV